MAIRVDLEKFRTTLLSERPVAVGLAKSLFENFLHRAFGCCNYSAVEPDHNDHDQYLVPTASTLLPALSVTASDEVAADQLNMHGVIFVWGYC